MATDYTTECGSVALRFLQMLAGTIYGYADIAGVTHYRINSLQETTNCTDLTGLIDCDTSHIEPERQLVENVFTLDDCELLALKIFNNADDDWTDYGLCAEMPKTFVEMLARTIVNHDGHYRINAVIDSGACTEATQLLDCVTNQIESERLLVTNVFATDDCDNFLIKMFSNSSTMTDYHTECVDMAQSFYQLLARCIVEYDGHYYINTALVTGYCDDLTAFWTCAISHIDPERALVENVFATDECGNLALKIFSNAGEEGREQ